MPRQPRVRTIDTCSGAAIGTLELVRGVSFIDLTLETVKNDDGEPGALRGRQHRKRRGHKHVGLCQPACARSER